MQIIEDKYLAIRTRNPDKIKEVIPDSQSIKLENGIHTVAVKWELQKTQQLYQLHFKKVPSPILRDYDWPGVYPPMAHQRTTAEFLTLNTRAFVFNEQGTGKTASAIWASDYLIKEGFIRRVLIVCPLSIMQPAWQSDLFKCAVHRSVGIAHGKDKRRKVLGNLSYQYVIINYDGVTIEADYIAKCQFDLIIVDEANAYKCVSTKRWKEMNKVVSKDTWLWMMTGTPAAQSPVDAYGLAKLCVPHKVPRHVGAFKDSVMFNVSRFKWMPKSDSAEKVHNCLQPAIRFTKKECLDLPEVTYVDREALLTPQQVKYYNMLKKDFLVESEGEEISAANAAVNLNKLLQISGGAVYSDSGATIEFDVSNRLSVVEEVIHESSNKVLIFVPFTHTITILKEYLVSKNIPSEVIYGEVNVTKRNEIFNIFQTKGNNELKVLIVQPKAASHGVTLTAADTVIWYAPVPSAETYLQANARIDRKGQRNPMTVVHITGSAVEKKLYAMLRGKLDAQTKLVDLYKQVLTE
jgi:SNF2 family DNA or RNA helicase